MRRGRQLIWAFLLGAVVIMTLIDSKVVLAAEENQAFRGNWEQKESGDWMYRDENGNIARNQVTPDGYYVDGNGIWIPDEYNVEDLKAGENTSQPIVVAGKDSCARVTIYNKEADGTWSTFADTGAYIGRKGLGKEKEGDEKTPVGLFSLDKAFGIQPNPGSVRPYTQLTDSHYWVGDSSSRYYNQFVDRNETGEAFNASSSEHLLGCGRVYNYVLSIGYNKECIPYRGSAIFLHCSAGVPTGGCVAVPEEIMVNLLKTIRDDAVILIDSGENIGKY